MNCAEYEEIVAADVDDELEDGERAAAAAHVSTCARCRALRAAQESVRTLLRQRAQRHVMPPELRRQVVAAIDEEVGVASLDAWRNRLGRPYRLMIGGAVAALLALVVAALLRPAQPVLLAQLVKDVHAVNAGEIDLALKTNDVGELRRYYREVAGFSFDRTVDDFSAKGLTLVGGMKSSIDSTPTTLSIYDSVRGKVVCRRFRAGTVPIPEGGEQVGNARLFTIDGVTVSIIRISKDVYCCLASSMPRAFFARAFAESGSHH
jgi:Putative zinc-finger